MNFDLQDLRAFVAVADLGSFRAAADGLHLSQPALSRRVDKLEQALGFRLFERTTRKVELNAMGRSFLPKARHVLHELEGALLGMADLSDRLRGQVTVACVPSAVASVVAEALRVFQDRYPGIRVRLVDDSAPEVLLAVARAEADFGISYLGTQEPDLEFRPLVDEPFVVACPADHPLAQRESVTWADLVGHRCVMLAPGSGNRMLIDQAVGALPERPAWACEVRHVPALVSLVEVGIGVGVAPQFSLASGPRANVVGVPLREPRVVRTIGMIRRRGQPLSAAAEAFHELLVRAAAEGRRRSPRARAGQ